MNINLLKSKIIQYRDKKLYVLNNIDNEKLNEYSTFTLASITKLFTFFTILLLQQDKLLDVNDKVNKYIKHEDFDKITILDLLYHKAGLINTFNLELFIKIFLENKNLNFNATNVLKYFINDKLIVTQIGIYSYSNIGYIILGVIMEKITNLSYFELFTKYILKPLKMKNTNIDYTNIILYNNDELLAKEIIICNSYGASGGFLNSCCKDLIKFSKNIFKLINKNSFNIIKNASNIFYSFDNKFIITHEGNMCGIDSKLEITYKKKIKKNNNRSSFICKNIFIKLSTNTTYNLDKLDKYFNKN